MARQRFNKKKLYEKSMEALNFGGMFCLADIIGYCGCDRHTYQHYLPPESDERVEVEQMLENAKRKSIVSIRQKLYKSTNPGALLALYKMICTPEERDQISYSKTDITSNGKDIKSDPIVVEVIDSRDKVDSKEE